MAAFLPDVVPYQPGVPAAFAVGGGNGRALDDDSFDIAVEVLAGSRLGNASTPRPATPAFPYLSLPQTKRRARIHGGKRQLGRREPRNQVRFRYQRIPGRVPSARCLRPPIGVVSSGGGSPYVTGLLATGREDFAAAMLLPVSG